jgi:hypothetical protein
MLMIALIFGGLVIVIGALLTFSAKKRHMASPVVSAPTHPGRAGGSGDD